mmetsp:Transcript_6065/g.14691  ORF Transcript_6065/g.14691 Transcript_6065/m.14691 type:complete len:245 (+) Transcript_6065:1295-2029(+)
MCAHNGGVLGKLGQETLELGTCEGRYTKGIGISLFHGLSPCLFGVATQFRGDSREIGIKMIECLDHFCLVALNVQKVVKDRRVAAFHGPGTSRIGDAVVTKSHPNGGDNHRWFVFVSGLLCFQDFLDGNDFLVTGIAASLGSRLSAHVEPLDVWRLGALQLHRFGSCGASLHSTALNLVREGNLELVRWIGVVLRSGHEGIDVAVRRWVILVKVVCGLRPSPQKLVGGNKNYGQDSGHCSHQLY